MSDTNTLLLEDILADYVEGNLESNLINGQISKLEVILSRLLAHPITFGDYIYLYLYEKYHDTPPVEKKSPLYPYIQQMQSSANYRDVPAAAYYKMIQKLFQANGLQGRGSLSGKTTTLNKLKGHFLKYPAEIDRSLIYLFGYGLDMTLEEIAECMNLFLMQRRVNLRDHEEVIYYWCLKHIPAETPEEKIARIKKVEELLEYYKELPTSFSHEDTDFSTNDMALFENSYTRELSQAFDSIKTEEKLHLYLTKLKHTSSKYISLSIRDQFFTNLSSCTQNDDARSKGDCARPLTASLFALKDLMNRRKEAYEKNKEQLLNQEIAAQLFQGIHWTRSTLTHRYSREKSISRNEFLLSMFLCNASDSVLVEELGTVAALYYDIRMDWDDQLEKSGMEATYVKNPFDLFLLICWLHKHPMEYLLANWYLADQWHS